MSWLCFVPPVIVFVLGFTTRRIVLSLFVGVLSAACIAGGFMPIQSASYVVQGIWQNVSNASNFYILSFVLMLGVLIEMIRQSHAANAFVDCVETSVKGKRSAETGALALSHFLAIDDYLSSLTVGAVMRPLTDRFKIPRVKLAFLADSMAAPLAMLTPVSSWAAAIIGFLTDNGVHAVARSDTLLLANPYSVYLNILPYIFYSITLVASVWFIVRLGLSFGGMHEHEMIAENTGNLAGGKHFGDKMTDPEGAGNATIMDFLIPIGSLMGSTLFFLLYLGNYSLFGGTFGLIETLQNAPISLVLFNAGLTALAVSTTHYLLNRKFSTQELLRVVKMGIDLMFPVAMILLLSWTLGGLLRDELRTGEWLASLIAGSIPVVLMPLILFWNATLISLALGSSWATTAIMLPIAVPMVMHLMGAQAPVGIEELPILFPVFGAILSGAVCGDHVSLISETTIMSTTSAMCDHMDHVKTQFVYSLPVFTGCSAAFLMSGFLLQSSSWISLAACIAVSTSISFGLLGLMHYREKTNQAAMTV